MKPLRIAAVDYLNARPLYQQFIDLPSEGSALTLGSPREVARMLSEGECDVALMPVAAAASYGGLAHVPGIAIACEGAVRSVLIVSECPTAEIRELSLDLSSRTSVVLARLVLQHLGVSPVLKAMPPSEALASVTGTCGALVIGDPALAAEARFPHVLDLGKAWHAWTGLPFVFAAWFSASNGPSSASIAEALSAAKTYGLAKRDVLASVHAAKHGLEEAQVRSYLNDSIRYDLGAAEQRGLERFYDEAYLAGLLPRVAPQAESVRESLDALLRRASAGARLSALEGERIFQEASLFELGTAADAVRKRKHPEGVVTYIVDRNVNYTNVCTTSCRFCAFYRPVGHAEGYVLSRDVLREKLQEVVSSGGVQILLQGGLNPELRIEWYEDLFRWMKQEFKLGLHALSPEEILHLSELEGLSVYTVLARLRAAGLDSVPGGGAEILVDSVRKVIAKTKCRSEAWLSVMRTAHHMGLRSSATMMYGTVDTPRDRMLHLLKLRDLQDETQGFTAFFCWDFQHEQGTHIRPSATGTEHYLRMQAVARLMLDNIANVGASWVTQGPDVGQVALRFGANDFGSVMFEENVVSSAGTTFRIDAAAIESKIREAGFRSVRRNVRYDWLGEPA
jgi:cyclic dehypoxanthinyl futalosine synthase